MVMGVVEVGPDHAEFARHCVLNSASPTLCSCCRLHRQERTDDGECGPSQVLADSVCGWVLPQPARRPQRSEGNMKTLVVTDISLNFNFGKIPMSRIQLIFWLIWFCLHVLFISLVTPRSTSERSSYEFFYRSELGKSYWQTVVKSSSFAPTSF